jgi:hypothetical protein
MNSIHTPDRETRFQDACKFAAAIVVVGFIVVAGEAAMHRTPSLGDASTPTPIVDVGAADYFPHQYTLQAGEPETHVEAF